MKLELTCFLLTEASLLRLIEDVVDSVVLTGYLKFIEDLDDMAYDKAENHCGYGISFEIVTPMYCDRTDELLSKRNRRWRRSYWRNKSDRARGSWRRGKQPTLYANSAIYGGDQYPTICFMSLYILVQIPVRDCYASVVVNTAICFCLECLLGSVSSNGR